MLLNAYLYSEGVAAIWPALQQSVLLGDRQLPAGTYEGSEKIAFTSTILILFFEEHFADVKLLGHSIDALSPPLLRLVLRLTQAP